MLSLNNLGVICISQALQHSPKLLAIRQCLSKASSRATLYNNSITFSSKGTRRHTGFRLLNESIVKHVSSLQRTFCTASAKLHCWNCGQSVEQTPAFFCLSCNFVQPPDERASYFLIMEWWVIWRFQLKCYIMFTHSLGYLLLLSLLLLFI